MESRRLECQISYNIRMDLKRYRIIILPCGKINVYEMNLETVRKWSCKLYINTIVILPVSEANDKGA